MTQEQEGPPLDYGTPELRSKHDYRIVTPPVDPIAGDTAVLIEDGCLIDRLLRREKLGPLDADGKPLEATAKRHTAGTWLRELYDRAGMRKRSTMAYSAFGMGGGDRENSAAMTDAEAWNHRCFNETMRDLGRYQYVVYSVCVDDAFPKGGRYKLSELLFGLDKLADLRGI